MKKGKAANSAAFQKMTLFYFLYFFEFIGFIHLI
jgi:hypothetical protein